jgi:hypothetical protein
MMKIYKFSASCSYASLGVAPRTGENKEDQEQEKRFIQADAYSTWQQKALAANP